MTKARCCLNCIGETYSFAEQQFLMGIVLGSAPEEIINVELLKEKVREYAAKLQEDKDMKGNYDELEAALKAEVMTIDEVKKAAIEKAAKAEIEKKRQADEAAAAEAAIKPAGDSASDIKDKQITEKAVISVEDAIAKSVQK
jgi:hypothetical protein